MLSSLLPQTSATVPSRVTTICSTSSREQCRQRRRGSSFARPRLFNPPPASGLYRKRRASWPAGTQRRLISANWRLAPSSPSCRTTCVSGSEGVAGTRRLALPTAAHRRPPFPRLQCSRAQRAPCTTFTTSLTLWRTRLCARCGARAAAGDAGPDAAAGWGFVGCVCQTTRCGPA